MLLQYHLSYSAIIVHVVVQVKYLLNDELSDVRGLFHSSDVLLSRHHHSFPTADSYSACLLWPDGTPAPQPVPVCDDPDDDAVIACAVAASADVIVSGDDDLLRLGSYGTTHILTAAELLQRLAAMT